MLSQTLLTFFKCLFISSVLGLETIEITKSVVINISNHSFAVTGHIASINGKYFFVSYENVTQNQSVVPSQIAEVYDVGGKKINDEDIILAHGSFNGNPAQCQCNYNNNNVSIQNNLMFGWIYDFIESNASYRILHTSTYNPLVNSSYIDMSPFIIADKTGINDATYAAQIALCACLRNGQYVYMWQNGDFLNYNNTINEYMIFIDQNGNKIGNDYYIESSYYTKSILLPCIDYNEPCDTFLVLGFPKFGYLYSVQNKGMILRNEFLINQHATTNESDQYFAAISLSNGLYCIVYHDTKKDAEFKQWNIMLLETKNATQISINNVDNYKLEINTMNVSIKHDFKMKEIKDLSNGNLIYLCMIYTDGHSVYGSIYKIVRNNDSDIVGGNIEIVDQPFFIFENVDWGIDAVYLASIGNNIMTAWQTYNSHMFQSVILTVNITQ